MAYPLMVLKLKNSSMYSNMIFSKYEIAQLFLMKDMILHIDSEIVTYKSWRNLAKWPGLLLPAQNGPIFKRL